MTTKAIRVRDSKAGALKTQPTAAVYLNTKDASRPKVGMAENIINPNVLGFLDDYLKADNAQEQGEWLAGEIYYLYFQATPDTQEQFVVAMCKRLKLDVPKVEMTPRQRLIYCLFGNRPEYVRPREPGGDCPAGVRISMAIGRFMDAAGLARPRKKRMREYLPRKTRDFVFGLYEVGTRKEIEILNALIVKKYGAKGHKIAARYEQKAISRPVRRSLPLEVTAA